MPTSILHGLMAAVAITGQADIGQETYPAAFFAPYAPQNALEMVQRLPGFQPDLGDSGVRGFAEGGGNILIDGARPASKAGGLSSALAAIPVGQVARIEINRGAATAGEASGQTVVANIVRLKRRGGVAVNAELSRRGDNVRGKASVIVTRSLGALEIVSKTSFDAPGERSHGTRRTFDLSGRAKEGSALAYAADFPELSQRLNLSSSLAGGEMKVAATLARARLSEGFSFSDAVQAQSFPKRTARWRGEIGGDWSRPVGAGYGLKLLGFASIIDLDARSWSQIDTGGSVSLTDSFESQATSRETIARAVVAKAAGVLQPEIGGEIAWNSLENRSISSRFGASPSRSVSAVDVSETRSQAFATLNWRPGPRWTIAAGAAYEASHLQSGDGERDFGFFKPSLTATYRPDDHSNLRLSIRRSVGQLSFGDFAASASLAEGRTNAGNAQLGPDHKTTATLDYERRFSQRGAISLKVAHEWRRDVLEASVLPSGAFGTVNVEQAKVWSVRGNLALPLNRILRNGLLNVKYIRQGARLNDPLTGERRALTSFQPETFEVELRQDLATASWGVDYARGFQRLFWYQDEARVQDHGADLGLYVETRRVRDARITLRLDGLLGTRTTYSRLQYAPSRAGRPIQREVWDIRTPFVTTVAVSRNF
jgi:hypothetical protein